MARLGDQFRQVFRRLARAPLFAAITLITLAVGIGANTVVFSVVEGVLLKPLSYPHAEQLIGVWSKAPGINIPQLPLAPYVYFIDREQNTTLQDIGLYTGDSVTVTGSGQPEHVQGIDVTDGTLPLLGVKPVLGRVFSRHDDSPDVAKTVILTYGYWQRHFGRNRSVLGQSLTIDGKAHEIIGVLPRDFQFADDREIELFLPMGLDRAKTKLGNFSWQGLARLKPGVSINQANADLARLIPIANHSFPPPDGISVAMFEKAGLHVDVHSLKNDVVGDVGNVLWVLMGSIVVVLLVACANVANLLLVRVEGRRQELAVRSALGAGRGNITAGLLAESLVLSVGGTILGLALAFGALRVLVALAPTGLPRLHEIGINLPVLLFTLLVALFVSVVIGMIPIVKYSGISMYTGLREGGRTLSESRERHRARKALVVIQVALALILLICSGLMIRTFRALAHVSPGFADPQSLMAFHIGIPETQIPDTQQERVLRTEQAIADKLAAMPGVTSVSIATSVPMNNSGQFDPVFAADHTYKEGELAPIRRFKFVSPGFLATMGTPIVAGRDVTWDETYQKRPVALISENFAREYWGTPANALGRRIRVGSTDDWREIIGVAGDVYDDGVSQPASTCVYWPLFMNNFEGQKERVNRGVNFVLRSSRAGSAAFKSEAEQAVWSINRDLPLANTTTLGELYRKSMARTSFTLIMLCVAGSMALLLGIVGIYGVISYAVSQRTREIGIRMALGAESSNVLRLFLGQGALLILIAFAIGLPIALVVARLFNSILYGVQPHDLPTFATIPIFLAAVALAATFIPARRASRTDPMVSLRYE